MENVKMAIYSIVDFPIVKMVDLSIAISPEGSILIPEKALVEWPQLVAVHARIAAGFLRHQKVLQARGGRTHLVGSWWLRLMFPLWSCHGGVEKDH